MPTLLVHLSRCVFYAKGVTNDAIYGKMVVCPYMIQFFVYDKQKEDKKMSKIMKVWAVLLCLMVVVGVCVACDDGNGENETKDQGTETEIQTSAETQVETNAEIQTEVETELETEVETKI